MTPAQTLWLLLAALTLLGVLIAYAIDGDQRPVPMVNIAQRLARPPRPIVVTCGECHVALCVQHSAKDAALEDELHHLLCHRSAA